LGKIVSESLHLKVEQALIKIVEDSGNQKLKSEEELAQFLGVSRTTIREAMNRISKKGILTKRHGKGNFMHKSALDDRFRIDLHHNFSNLIKSGGHNLRLVRTLLDIQTANKKVGEKLCLAENELVIRFLWTYYADEIPAIFVYRHIPVFLFKMIPDHKEIIEDTRLFLEKYCNQDLAHFISKIKPVLNNKIDQDFGLEVNTPLIMWEEILYNIYDDIIGYDETYFNPNIIDLSLLIKI
jgi:GntR family transcriptional regulator